MLEEQFFLSFYDFLVGGNRHVVIDQMHAPEIESITDNLTVTQVAGSPWTPIKIVDLFSSHTIVSMKQKDTILLTMMTVPVTMMTR